MEGPWEKGSKLCDIATSAAGDCKGGKSSYEVADEMQADAARALSLIKPLKSGGDAQLEAALSNIRQMACLSAYYAHKVRGATLKKAGERRGPAAPAGGRSARANR